jgi:hypothetical protein
MTCPDPRNCDPVSIIAPPNLTNANYYLKTQGNNSKFKNQYRVSFQSSGCLNLILTINKLHRVCFPFLLVVSSSPSISKLLRAQCIFFVAEPVLPVPLGALHIRTAIVAVPAGTL